MTEDRDSLKQKLCLLLDNELGRDESLKLLSRVETDPELRAQWRRYNLIGMALREKDALLPDSGFVDRVSAALADEPTILAPRPVAKRGRRETAVTFALAASLAAVAVLVGKSLSDYSPTSDPGLLAQSDLAANPTAPPNIDPEFRDYLVAHYETAYLAGAQGMLPSVRLVSSDLNR
jgi:sigma-E factor negative regulatory protein RseA